MEETQIKMRLPGESNKLKQNLSLNELGSSI